MQRRPSTCSSITVSPEKYESRFEEIFLPHLSVLVNCIYWDARYPRLVTKD